MSDTHDIWREIGPALTEAMADAPFLRLGGAMGDISSALTDLVEFGRLNARMDHVLDGLRVIERRAADVQERVETQERTITALRAVLAPLLDDPFEGDTGTIYCRFCDRSLGGGYGTSAQAEPDPLAYSPRDDARFVHAPDCPVLRRDALLGR